MKINGEAIYGTRIFSSFNEGDNIRFTQSKDGKTRYIFLFEYPDEKVVISKIPFTINTKVQLLGSAQKIGWKNVRSGVEIDLPAGLKGVGKDVWVLKVMESN
jgi:alpha-L-fucosidase